MHNRQDMLLALALAITALFFGWWTGELGWSLFLALSVWTGIHLKEQRRLDSWSRHPLRRPDSELLSWQAIANRLFRSLKQARNRTHNVIARLRALRMVTEALPDAAIVLSANGDIDDLNEAAGRVLNLQPKDRGQSLASLVRQPAFIALARANLDDDLVEFTSPLNESIRLEARRVQIAEGRSLLLVRDVTELNRLLSMRQDFIANVSHELRTPLTVIVGYIETLLSEDLDRATTLDLIEKLRSPTTRMRALVDDLLLLTRLESSPNPSHDELSLIDVRGLIKIIAADGNALSSGRHKITSFAESSAMVVGIEHELLSAFLNLLTNAVRYSPDGGNIELRWADIAGGARFSVSDQGIGIPPEHLSRITERFYRVDLAKSRVRGGTGLGLAIVKHVLKRHNSELEIVSELNKGSTFFCDIPESQLNRTSDISQEIDK